MLFDFVDQAGPEPALSLPPRRAGPQLSTRPSAAPEPSSDPSSRSARAGPAPLADAPEGPALVRRGRASLSWLSARYDAAERETDESLGELVAGLKARGLWEPDGARLHVRPRRGAGRASAPRARPLGCRAAATPIPYLFEEHIRIPLARARGVAHGPARPASRNPSPLDRHRTDDPRSLRRPASAGHDRGVARRRPRPGRVVVSEASPYGAVARSRGEPQGRSSGPGFRTRHWETGEWLDRLPAEECFDLAADPGEQQPDRPARSPGRGGCSSRPSATWRPRFPATSSIRAEPARRPVPPRRQLRQCGRPSVSSASPRRPRLVRPGAWSASTSAAWTARSGSPIAGRGRAGALPRHDGLRRGPDGGRSAPASRQRDGLERAPLARERPPPRGHHRLLRRARIAVVTRERGLPAGAHGAPPLARLHQLGTHRSPVAAPGRSARARGGPSAAGQDPDPHVLLRATGPETKETAEAAPSPGRA